MKISKALFDTLPDGSEVYIYTLEASDNFKAELISYGANLRSLIVPDKDKRPVNVALGFKTLSGYMTGGTFYGTTVGPVGNRIKNASFTLNGITYQLEANEAGRGNTLHSGTDAFDKKNWESEAIENGVRFHLEHNDLDQGFPGNISIDITYYMPDDHTLAIDYKAVSDKDTVLDMTNHSYFNLNGDPKGTILDHKLKLFCNYYLETDECQVPTGKKVDVKGTPFDFTEGKLIGKDIDADNRDIKIGCGYDHYFVGSEEKRLRPLAILTSESSGISMEYSSDKPGLMVYTGNYLKESPYEITFGIPNTKNIGVAFEAQCYPDSPNHPERTDVTLKSGDTYHSVTTYRFI